MSLQITYNDPESNITVTDSYHKVTGVLDNRLNSTMQIHVSIYKDSTEKDAGNYVRYKGAQFAKITCSGDDYDTYFGTDALDVVDQNPIERAYVFLKTQDPDVADYSGDCPFDYKNDSTDV